MEDIPCLQIQWAGSMVQSYSVTEDQILIHCEFPKAGFSLLGIIGIVLCAE